MGREQTAYPVQYSVDYPNRQLDRTTTFFRLFAAIPMLILLSNVDGGTWQWTSHGRTTAVAAGAGGLLVFAPLLVTDQYPPFRLSA
jgi:hypothetical protein